MTAIIWSESKRTNLESIKISWIFLPTSSSTGGNGSMTKRSKRGMAGEKCAKSGEVTHMNEFFERDWAGIAQVFKIRRYVETGGKEHEEIVYGFTNLPRKKAGAKRLRYNHIKRWSRVKNHENHAQFTRPPPLNVVVPRLLELNQKHWSIENRLHYRRDVTLGEDACQVRIKGAPQVLAALNGGVLATFGLVGRHQCRFSDAPFLCPPARCSPLAAWQAFTVIRVLRKALLKRECALTKDMTTRRCATPGHSQLCIVVVE
jgi:hypothetical protein